MNGNIFEKAPSREPLTEFVFPAHLSTCIRNYIFVYLATAACFGAAYKFSGGIVDAASRCAITPSSLQAFHFSFSTQSTLGYGELIPVSIFARSLSVIQALSGIILNATMLVGIARLVTRSHSHPTPSWFLIFDPSLANFQFLLRNDSQTLTFAEISIRARVAPGPAMRPQHRKQRTYKFASLGGEMLEPQEILVLASKEVEGGTKSLRGHDGALSPVMLLSESRIEIRIAFASEDGSQKRVISRSFDSKNVKCGELLMTKGTGAEFSETSQDLCAACPVSASCPLQPALNYRRTQRPSQT